MPKDSPELSATEFAAITFITLSGINAMVRSGKLVPCSQIGGEPRFSQAQAQEFFRQQSQTKNTLLWVAAKFRIPPQNILAWVGLKLVYAAYTREGYLWFSAESLQHIKNLKIGSDNQESREQALLSISEAAEIVKVSTHALRAWEKRYRIVTPTRTPLGHRRYTLAQLEILRAFHRSRYRQSSTAAGLDLLLEDK